MENTIITIDEAIDMIDARIDGILMNEGFDFQNYRSMIKPALLFRVFNEFRDGLEETLPRDFKIMTKKEMETTLDNLESKMTELLDDMEDDYGRAFFEGANSIVEFSELI